MVYPAIFDKDGYDGFSVVHLVWNVGGVLSLSLRKVMETINFFSEVKEDILFAV